MTLIYNQPPDDSTGSLVNLGRGLSHGMGRASHTAMMTVKKPVTNLPLPPKRPGYWGWAPMPEWEADLIVRSYNEWADRWNAAEVDRRHEFEPKWGYATIISGGRPRAMLQFKNSAGRWGCIRFANWECFKSNGKSGIQSIMGPYIRNKIDPDSIMWGGWRLARPAKRGDTPKIYRCAI